MRAVISTVVVFCLLAYGPIRFSQERTKSVHIARTDNPPEIDGLIEDEWWGGSESVSGFLLSKYTF